MYNSTTENWKDVSDVKAADMCAFLRFVLSQIRICCNLPIFLVPIFGAKFVSVFFKLLFGATYKDISFKRILMNNR